MVNESLNESNKIKEIILKFWNNFHKFGLWATLFMLGGIFIGISISKTYYTQKIDEVILVGGMAHKGIVYQISKK